MEATAKGALGRLILLVGCSGSGKSTIAAGAAAALGCPTLCLDAFWRRGARKVMVDTPRGKVRSFERPELYDGAKLAAAAAARSGDLIAEGFCLLQYPEIAGLQAARFFIDVPFPIAASRRAARKPQRPSDESFSILGEDETKRFVIPQAFMPGVVKLDGMRPVEEIIAELLSHVAGLPRSSLANPGYSPAPPVWECSRHAFR